MVEAVQGCTDPSSPRIDHTVGSRGIGQTEQEEARRLGGPSGAPTGERAGGWWPYGQALWRDKMTRPRGCRRREGTSRDVAPSLGFHLAHGIPPRPTLALIPCPGVAIFSCHRRLVCIWGRSSPSSLPFSPRDGSAAATVHVARSKPSW